MAKTQSSFWTRALALWPLSIPTILPSGSASGCNPSRWPFHSAEHLCQDKCHQKEMWQRKGPLKASFCHHQHCQGGARSQRGGVIDSPSHEVTAQLSHLGKRKCHDCPWESVMTQIMACQMRQHPPQEGRCGKHGSQSRWEREMCLGQPGWVGTWASDFCFHPPRLLPWASRVSRLRASDSLGWIGRGAEAGTYTRYPSNKAR